MNWTYDGDDPGIRVFTEVVSVWGGRGFDFLPGQRILELGARDTDWLERVHAMDHTLSLVALDYRTPDRATPGPWVQADIAAPHTWQGHPQLKLGTFDWVVSLSTIEHVGMGFYGDPPRRDGDHDAVWHAARWLKQGGSFYFDVPYNPIWSVSPDWHLRVYDQLALGRLRRSAGLHERGQLFCECVPGTATERERVGAASLEPPPLRIPFSFVGCWWTREWNYEPR